MVTGLGTEASPKRVCPVRNILNAAGEKDSRVPLVSIVSDEGGPPVGVTASPQVRLIVNRPCAVTAMVPPVLIMTAVAIVTVGDLA